MSAAMARPTLALWGLGLAAAVAVRGTCARRQVGCVLLDADGRVLATGYNGPAVGALPCRPFSGLTSQPCVGAELPSGSGLDLCDAVHAEQNALLQCADVRRIHWCCVTVSPCLTCVKLLLNTGCAVICFLEAYADASAAGRLWERTRGAGGWLRVPS